MEYFKSSVLEHEYLICQMATVSALPVNSSINDRLEFFLFSDIHWERSSESTFFYRAHRRLLVTVLRAGKI